MMPLYEEFHFRKKHLTCQNVVDRAEARRNRHEFWRSANLSFREHQRYLKLAIGASLVVAAVILYLLVRP
jgi:hypothetical protein